MRTIATATFVALAASLTLVACSTDDTPLPPPGGGTGPGGGSAASRSTFTLNADVVPSDPAFNEAVEVRPDSLVLPRAGFEHLLGSLQVNQVVFGEWATGQPERNPVGFSRRVESVREEGNTIVIATRPAGLDDIFAEAEIFIDTTETEAPLDPTSLQLLAPPARTSGTLSFNPKVNFGFDTGGTGVGGSGGGVNGQAQGSIALDFYIHPQVSGAWSKKSWRPTQNQIDLDIGFPFDIGAKSCGAIKTTLSGPDFLENLLKSKNLKTLFDSPPVPIGTPLGLTAKAYAKGTCYPFGAAAAQIESEGRVYGNPGIKFGYNGDWYVTPRTEFGAGVSLTTILEGTIGVRCEIELGLELSSYGTLSVKAGYVPYADVVTLKGTGRRTLAAGATQDDTPNHASDREFGSVCLDTAFSHRADVGVSAQVFGYEVGSFTQTVWNGERYPLAEKCTGNICSANDEVDTWYCSPGSSHAHTCSATADGGRAFNGNLHCPTGEKCQPNGPNDWRAQLNDDGTPKCGTEEVQQPNDEALSCVASNGWAGPR